jgi:hypothetical protein
MKFWETFDFSGIEAKLYINGKEKYATVSGAILNFLALVGIISISLVFFLDFFSGKQFSIIYSQINDFDKNLNFSEIPFMFTATTVRGGYLNSSILYFSVQYSNHTVGGKTFYNPISFEKCDKDKHLGKYRNLFEKIDISNYYCIAPNQDINIQGVVNDIVNGYTYMTVFILKCQNNSIYNPNPGKCASPSEIDSAIAASPTVIGVMTVDFNVNHDATDNPLVPYVMADSFPVTPALNYRNYLPFVKSFYTYDDGYIFENKRTFTYYQKGQTYFNIYINQTLAISEAFGIINIPIHQKADQYLKTYVKLPVIIANIGGIMKSLLMMAVILNYKAKSSLLVVELINSFFDHDVKEEKDSMVVNIMSTVNKPQLHVLTKKEPKKFQLKYSQIILPKLFLTKESKKQVVYFEKMKKVLEKKLSLENILDHCQSYEDFKYLILNQEQLYVFDRRPKRSYSYYNELNGETYNETKMNDCLNKIRINESTINKRLLELF